MSGEENIILLIARQMHVNVNTHHFSLACDYECINGERKIIIAPVEENLQ